LEALEAGESALRLEKILPIFLIDFGGLGSWEISPQVRKNIEIKPIT
jgi:hypothetical protein